MASPRGENDSTYYVHILYRGELLMDVPFSEFGPKKYALSEAVDRSDLIARPAISIIVGVQTQCRF
jgi:hypothetical protein